jgi:hypothetical protein
MTNTIEKVSIVLPYPPKAVTKAPTKKTAVAVTSLPTLKQMPVAVARMWTGKSWGI